MLLVVIESPLAAHDEAQFERNRAYAKEAMLDSLNRGEAPYASHLLFAQKGLLDDRQSDHRDLGIRAGFAWGEKADLIAVYADLGISLGMRLGIQRASMRGQQILYRYLYKENQSHASR